MTDQPDRLRPTPVDEPGATEPIVRAPGADSASEIRAPAHEDQPGTPDQPPGENPPVGDGGGAGMDNDALNDPDPGRDRFRDMRM